jgi:hypothetical protein
MEQAFKNTIVNNDGNVNGIESVLTDCKQLYYSWDIRAADNEYPRLVLTLPTLNKPYLS